MLFLVSSVDATDTAVHVVGCCAKETVPRLSHLQCGLPRGGGGEVDGQVAGWRGEGGGLEVIATELARVL